MSDTPTGRSWTHNPLRVLIESGYRSNVFLPDPRVECVSLLLGSDDQVSKATLTVYAGPLQRSDLAHEPALRIGDVLNGAPRGDFKSFLSSDQRVLVIREDPAGLADDETGQAPPPQVLFCGLCDRREYHEASQNGQTDRGFVFEVDGQFKRLGDQVHAQIMGARMRTAAAHAEAAEDPISEDPSGGPADTVIVRGRPCVFNPGGRGNRSRRAVSATIGERTVSAHVMVDVNDSTAEKWTWAQALRYLVTWHVLQFLTAASWDETGLITDGNLFDLTDATIGEPTPVPIWRASIASRPPAPATRANAFAFAVLGEPRDFDCDGLNAPEALVLAAEHTGLHFNVRTEGVTEDGVTVPIDRLYWWARGAGPIKDLHREVTLENQYASGEPMSAEETLAKSTVNTMTIETDDSDVILSPLVVGGVRQYEITVELVPGWRPDANVDVDPANQAAVDAAETYADAHTGEIDEAVLREDPWYRRYHRQGLDYHRYVDVGRRWIANTAGNYTAGVYARTAGPFMAARYEPWEPDHPYGPGVNATEGALNVGIADRYIDDAGQEAYRAIGKGEWARVGRPFKDCFSATAEGRTQGIYVEYSLDSGQHWKRLTAATRNLADEAGIQIEEADLTEIISKDKDDAGNDLNYWFALIRGLARVRATAVIEGDGRMEPNFDATAFGAPGARGASRLFDVSDRYIYCDRERGNSIFRGGGPKAVTQTVKEARVDLVGLQKYALGLLDVLTRRQISGAPVVPWLTTKWTETDGFRVGDCLRSIAGTGMEFRATTKNPPDRWVDVVAIRYSPADTTLVLDDFRWLDAAKPNGFLAGGPA